MPVTLNGTFYTVKEAAEKLGYASHTTLAAACKAGKVPCERIGSTWLVPESWLDIMSKEAPKGQGNRGTSREK